MATTVQPAHHSVASADYKQKNVDQIMAQRAPDYKEIRALLAWSNSYLSTRSFSSEKLEDFGDGVLLINLLEAAFRAHLGKYSSRPKLPIQKLENVSIAFTFMQSQNIPLISIDTHDIVHCKQKQLTIVLWLILRNILLRNMGVKLDTSSEEHKSGMTNLRERLLKWCQETFPSRSITDFAASFKDGTALCAIVDAIVPGKINVDSLAKENALDNIGLAFRVAEEQLGIPTLMEPEELAGSGVDEKVVMNYVAMLLSAAKASEKKEREIDEVKSKERETKESLSQKTKSAEEAKLAAEKATAEAMKAAEEAAKQAALQEEKRQALLQQKNSEILSLVEENKKLIVQVEQLTDESTDFREKYSKEAQINLQLTSEGEQLKKQLEATTEQYEKSARQVLHLETKTEELTTTHGREVTRLQGVIEKMELDSKQQVAQLVLTHSQELQQTRDNFNRQLLSKEAQTEEQRKELEEGMARERKAQEEQALAAQQAADKIAQEAKEAQVREQARARSQADADQALINKKNEELQKLTEELQKEKSRAENAEAQVQSLQKKLNAEKDNSESLLQEIEKLRKLLSEMTTRAQAAEHELYLVNTAHQTLRTQVQELIGQIRLRVQELKAQYRLNIQRLHTKTQLETSEHEEQIRKLTDEYRKEMQQLNSELYLLYREHELVLARVREEKRKNYLEVKQLKPNFDAPRQTLSVEDRIGAALREQKTEKDFVESMKPKVGFLLRRRPKAVFNRDRFKKLYFVLKGDTLEYYSKALPTEKSVPPKGKFLLKEYQCAEVSSTTQNSYSFRITPLKTAHDTNLVLELKATVEDSEADEKRGDHDKGIRTWLYEINRRIAITQYLLSVKGGKQKGCRELLDFVVGDHSECVWIQDKIHGIHPALVSLKNALGLRNNLKHIHFSNISLSDAALKVICDILKINNSIQKLELNDNLITEEGANHLASALKINHSLTLLDVDNNQLKDEGLIRISEAIPYHWNLAHLSINGNAIGDKGVQALCTAVQAMPKTYSGSDNTSANSLASMGVSLLSLSNLGMTSQGNLDLPKASSRRGSQDSGDTKDKDKDKDKKGDKDKDKDNKDKDGDKSPLEGGDLIGGHHVPHDPSTTALHPLTEPHYFPSIHLKYNLVGDVGCAALAELCKNNPSVTEINLEHNMVSDDGLISLMKALPHSKLTVLNCSDNQVSSKGMVELTRALQASQHNFTVDLSNNSLLGGAGISALVKTDLKLDYLLFKVRRKLQDDDKDDELGSLASSGSFAQPTRVSRVPSSRGVLLTTQSAPGTPHITPGSLASKEKFFNSSSGSLSPRGTSHSAFASAASSANPTPTGSPQRHSLPSTPMVGTRTTDLSPAGGPISTLVLPPTNDTADTTDISISIPTKQEK